MGSILIKNARILDPAAQEERGGDIRIEAGAFCRVNDGVKQPVERIIDATGLVAAPGLVDMHVHLRDPGFPQKEDFHSGAAAAAAGGFTTVAAMPNTRPAADSAEILRDIVRRAKREPIHILQVAAISKGLGRAEAVPFAALAEAGAAAFSDDGEPILNEKLLAEALREAHRFGLPLLAHCEDKTLAGRGIVNEGVAKQLGVRGIPAAAEDNGTRRETQAAEKLGLPVHICHVSTRGSLALIRAAKARGVPVTAETAPHYFALNENALLQRDANFRMNPPLRSEDDRQAVLEAIADGTIDAIATDHAPHTAQEKANFETAPNGAIGLEIALAAGITHLVKSDVISLMRLLELMSVNPARILGIQAGSLREGAAADLVLFDPEARWVVRPELFRSKSRSTPFAGQELTGQVRYTICAGKIVYEQ